MPYPPGEYPFPRPYTCDGKAHASRLVKVLEGDLELRGCTVMIEVCADPTCAKLFASCGHEECTWNKEATLLTCNFCGVDGT